MKRELLYLCAAASIMLTAACTKNGNTAPSDNEMRFEASFPRTRATASAFEAGDEMGVYVTKYNGEKPLPLQVSGNYATNIKSAFNGSGWVNTPTIYWEDGKFDVYAYYPYDKPASVDEYIFTVAEDQSLPETADALSGYEASDLLWAKTAGVARTDYVPLTFSHRMSCIVVNLVKGEDYSGDIPADAVVKIHNTVPVALVDLATGVVVKNGRSSAKTITAKKLSDTQFTAIVVPQRLENKIPLVEILSGGVSYLLESKFVFRSGTRHTINVTLSDNPDKIRIEIGGEIEDWGSAE